MANMAAYIVYGTLVKEQLNTGFTPNGQAYVYSSRKGNTSGNTLYYDVFVDRNNGQYPPKPSRWYSQFTRLYDALKRFNDLTGLAPSDIIPKTLTAGAPQHQVDSFKHGGSNAGG